LRLLEQRGLDFAATHKAVWKAIGSILAATTFNIQGMFQMS